MNKESHGVVGCGERGTSWDPRDGVEAGGISIKVCSRHVGGVSVIAKVSYGSRHCSALGSLSVGDTVCLEAGLLLDVMMHWQSLRFANTTLLQQVFVALSSK